MHTRKLYYEDCHLGRFSAQVLSCESAQKGYFVTLDATAFYPEGGGQACDLGTLASVNVLDVQEQGETVVHLCDGALPVGETVEGVIDYDRRFGLMVQHSADHIVSGLIFQRFGFHNVGFHMGAETVTLDFDGVISPEQLQEIELAANKAIWADLPIRCWYPTEQELPNVFYRSKKALPWPVRIVEIPGIDSCACCGVHVARTGEIGLIKLLGAVGLRGGTRVEMVCGEKALRLLNLAFAQNREVSQAFSAQWNQTGAAARQMNTLLAQEKAKVTALQRTRLQSIAKSYEGSGNVLHFEENLTPDLVRELSDGIADVCRGTAAVFSGSDAEGYSYALVTREGDLRAFGKEMTQALSGRGGGKPNFQQGKVSATENAIRDFFAGRSGV